MKWKATRADLIFGANSQLRATAEVYAWLTGEGERTSLFAVSEHPDRELPFVFLSSSGRSSSSS